MKILATLASGVAIAHALDNGVGQTPALGYNTWNDFRCNGISQANVEKVADKMVELGLVKLGYEYLNIDDCWAVSRDANNVLVPDPKAFPNGMKAVADYVHSKGLKFGIYTDRGDTTCAGRPASLGHEVLDAQTFADWGVDYLKEDSCNATQVHDQAFKEYATMRDALNKTGRPIYFSLCGWNSWYAPPGATLGNSWRIAGDCNQWPSVLNAIKTNEPLAPDAKIGGWNDPDMLVGSSPEAAVHNTPEQARTQFSLWSVMAAPLLIGSNILNLSAWDLETYSNEEMLAVDQDPLGIQGSVTWTNCGATLNNCQQIWARPLKDKAWALCLINYSSKAADITCDGACLQKLGFLASDSYSPRDLWAHATLPAQTGSFTVQAVGPDGASASFVLKKSTLAV